MKKIVLLCCLILIIFSCTKDYDQNLKCSDSKTFKTPQIIKDFFYFKTGTWWVYENTVTGAYDSMWVGEGFKELSTDSDKKKECNCGFGYCSEKITTKIYNLEYNLNSPETLKRRSYVDIIITKKFIMDDPSLDQATYDISIECVDNKYPVALYTIEGNSFPNSKNGQYITTYYTDTFHYDNKLIGTAWVGQEIIENKIAYRCAYVKNIGLYQYYIGKTGNLLLKRWHIVQ